MGFLGPEKNILTELSLKLDARGNCETPKDKYSTNIPKVYAAGGKNWKFCIRLFWIQKMSRLSLRKDVHSSKG